MKKAISFPAAVLILAALYASSRYNYLLFHGLAEIFSIVIGCGIFMTAWNSRQFLKNGYLLFIGIAYLFIGGLDLVHAFAYKGMAIFPGYGTNLPTQLWIAGRYMESLSLLAAPFMLRRQVRAPLVFLGYSVVTCLLLFLIFHQIFPDCFKEGSGLTPFKKGSEYVISVILLASAVFLLRRRQEFHRKVLGLITWSIAFTVASELSFTFYVHAYGLSNLVGHYFKIVSFYLIYKAIIETGLTRPYDLLFRELRQSEERYRSLFTHMTNGFAHHRVLLDEAGKPVDYVFLEVNEAFEECTGLRRADLIGRRVTEALPGIERDPAAWIDTYGKVAMTGAPVRFESRSEILKKWFSVTAYSPEKGYFVTVFEDITQRKQAEEELRLRTLELQHLAGTLETRVQERTAELSAANEALRLQTAMLERSNRDLEEFAHVASHDLQEPLRKLRTFSDLLLGQHHDGLNDSARDYLDRMQRSAERMHALVMDLLRLSRITSHSGSYTVFNLGEPVREALSDLGVLCEETEGRVEVGELPEVEADRVQMRQLFQNLIGNALKYRGERKPVVRVYGSPPGPDSFCDIHVEDNGIGFDESHLDKIFKPFQRLHGRSSPYEGTGMGLAICRRIAERHGGTITARSEPGKGSEFIVRLPTRQ